MRIIRKTSLYCLWMLLGFLPIAGRGLSAESSAFLSARPAGAQEEMTRAVRRALEGNFEALNRVRESLLQDVEPPAGIRVENTMSANRKIRFYYPGAKPGQSVVLYLHGGGWTIGGLEGSAKFCGELAKASGLDVATLDYRLAPESGRRQRGGQSRRLCCMETAIPYFGNHSLLSGCAGEERSFGVVAKVWKWIRTGWSVDGSIQ